MAPTLFMGFGRPLAPAEASLRGWRDRERFAHVYPFHHGHAGDRKGVDRPFRSP